MSGHALGQRMRCAGRLWAAAITVLLVGCAGWPLFSPPAAENLRREPLELGAVGVLPPELDEPAGTHGEATAGSSTGPAVVASKAPSDEKARRDRLVAEVLGSAVPADLASALSGMGVAAVVLSRGDLLRHVANATAQPDAAGTHSGWEEQLSYASLARARGLNQLLRLDCEASIWDGSGGDDWLFGLVSVDYPADTTWYDLRVTAEVLDPESGEAWLRAIRAGKSHSNLLTVAARTNEREMLEALAKKLARELVADLVGAARNLGAPLASEPSPQSAETPSAISVVPATIPSAAPTSGPSEAPAAPLGAAQSPGPTASPEERGDSPGAQAPLGRAPLSSH